MIKLNKKPIKNNFLNNKNAVNITIVLILSVSLGLAFYISMLSSKKTPGTKSESSNVPLTAAQYKDAANNVAENIKASKTDLDAIAAEIKNLTNKSADVNVIKNAASEACKNDFMSVNYLERVNYDINSYYKFIDIATTDPVMTAVKNKADELLIVYKEYYEAVINPTDITASYINDLANKSKAVGDKYTELKNLTAS